MRSILITGCNRGIGLGLVKQLAHSSKPPEHIFATCRDVHKARELRALAQTTENIHLIEIELTDMKRYGELAKFVADAVGDAGLNVLFNNAGVSTKFARLGLVKAEQLADAFLINVTVPIMLTKALAPLLKAASKTSTDKVGMSIEKAAVINMSSILGSITGNDDGGFYPYRCSKSALNAATKSMSIDFKNDGILAISLHPGWVRTDMGGNNAPMDVETSVTNILATLRSLSIEQTGCFLQYDGKCLPW